jgi:hypothetical protein
VLSVTSHTSSASTASTILRMSRLMQTPSNKKKTVLELKAFNLKTFISASGEPTNVLNLLHGLCPTYKDWVHRHIEINKIIPETETDINQVVTLRSTIQAAINEERTRRSALLQDGDDNHQALVATTRGLNAKEKWYCAGCDRMGYHHETECVIKHPHLKVAHEKRMEQKRLRVAEFHQRQADRARGQTSQGRNATSTLTRLTQHYHHPRAAAT